MTSINTMKDLLQRAKECERKSELVADKESEEKHFARPKSILEAFEQIVEIAKDSKLDKAFFEKASVPIRYASRILGLSPMQSVMLAIFVDKSDDSYISLRDVSGHIGCSTTRILRLSSEIDVLEEKHYLRASRKRDNITYRVPSDVIGAIKSNQPYVYVREPITDLLAFFDRIDKLIRDKGDDELTYDMLELQTNECLDEIKDTHFARTLARFGLFADAQMLFLFMANSFVNSADDCISFYDIETLYDDGEIPFFVKRGLKTRSMSLFAHNLIENVNNEGMARSDAFKLTEYAKTELLCELNLETSSKSDEGLIRFDSFPPKSLVYNPSESRQVAELKAILSPDRFAQVQERMRSAGMRQGFCSLFYGSPGTGKTETVYQLARATRRNILRVDVDKIKSCWVGESEKNIKKLFDRYRNICKGAEVAPILLFNEADAIFGVRMEGASKAVDKMENSLQNIILQEMESLEGIMIATTNLTTNLDKAFERRFLYKVRFARPTLEARVQIWRTMMPDLSPEEASELAKAYDLSGGEIENICRKRTVAAILSDDSTVAFRDIMELCRIERIVDSSKTKIGFR